MKLSEPINDPGQYVLQFSTSREDRHPFVIQTVGGGGELDFGGTVTWFSRVFGTSENVTMALYYMDRSESGQTVTKTLLQQVGRTYQIVCNKDEFVVALALKRLFGLCKYEPTPG
jgi:hypothetical protein